LQRYAAVIIVDTTADDLGPQLMTQLVPYVRDLGHGLVVIGGQNAYSMGGYGQTPLEQVLPVSMDLPKRQNQPTTAVALIIESLEEDTQVNISKEAGKYVVDLLGPRDLVAVNDAPFDGSAGWVVPLQHVVDKGTIDGAIGRMVPGDPESYAPMLQSAYEALRHTNAKIKHIILLGDGDAEDPSYQQLVQGIRAGGVTVSTVSTNGLGRNDFQTMLDIARWGGGRNYIANDPSKIPQIFLRETRTVARLGIVEGKFFPQELSANPMVRDLRRVAPLYGYIATTPKPAAEVVLASTKLDPVLAAWQYGLGRSVAWTSDAAGLWSKDWLRVPNANRFWANLASWVFPAAGSGHLFITASSRQGEGQISVSMPSSLGPDPSVTAHVLSPELQSTTLQLEPSSPGEFGGSFQEGAQGAYFVTVEAHGAGRADAGQIGMDVPYSPEYRSTGLNMPFLRLLAAAGGGSVITRPQDAWKSNLQPVLAEYDITLWLLLLAILLLPIDVGVRRLVVSRRELAAILQALPVRRTVSSADGPANQLVGALRHRRAQRDSLGLDTASAESMVFALPPKDAPTRTRTDDTRMMPATGLRTAGAPPQQTSEAAEEESIASKLLAAKRLKE
ncbi:MAG: glutamine amidotransferase, partial [Chloroflexota bacterium]|nr:glutamine amidotransferase [Chloroflexota bacterium]